MPMKHNLDSTPAASESVSAPIGLEPDSNRYTRSPLEQAAKMTGLGYWIWDAKSNALIAVSDEYAATYGVSIDAIHHDYASVEGMLALIHPDDKDRYLAASQALEYSVEYRIIRPDWEICHVCENARSTVDHQGQTSLIFRSVQDISEQKFAEQALRESEEKYRILANNIPAVIYQCKKRRRLFNNLC